MKFDEVLAALEAAGTAQNRKVYAKHGVGAEQFGVPFGVLRPMAKRIGANHGLARMLWEIGNHDARMIATMIADPKALGASDLDAWARDLDNYILTDAFAEMVARSPHAVRKGAQWRRSKLEWPSRAGWRIVAHCAMTGDDTPDAAYVELLGEIEAGIAAAKNRTRDAMNGALIAIGGRSPALRDAALAAAARIGKVEVDHGDTGCETPDAAPYIQRMWAHKAKTKPASKAKAKPAARPPRKSAR